MKTINLIILFLLASVLIMIKILGPKIIPMTIFSLCVVGLFLWWIKKEEDH